MLRFIITASVLLATQAYSKNYDAEIKKLTKLQYYVTQEDGTETAFDNKYWDNKKEGIYVDIVSGEALFSSSDKFDSKTGWPSFTRPIQKDSIVEKTDYSFLLNEQKLDLKSRQSSGPFV